MVPHRDESAQVEEARARLTVRDAFVALAAVAALWAFYAATFQARQFGDAALLVQFYMRYLEGLGQWGHVAYLPSAKALHVLLAPDSPVDGLRMLSSLSGALSGGFVYLLARLWGARGPAACAGALLYALAPGPWFFATTVEVHALHAACVGLCALVTLLVPWRRGLAAALGVAALLPLVFFSHQSGILLGPGFVLLTRWARLRSGARAFSPAELWLVVAPLYLAAFLGAIAIAAGSLESSIAGFLEGSGDTVRTFERAFELGGAWEGWLLPLGMISPLVLWAVLGTRLRGPRLAALLGLVVPPMAFFVLWGLPERGGYALPSAMFLAAAGAVALEPPSRARAALALLAVLLQASLGWLVIRGFDEPHWRERNELRRESVAQALPDGGVLISINVHNQFVEYQLHRVREVSLYDVFAISVRDGTTPEQFVRRVEPVLLPLLESSTDLALEGRNFIARKAPHLLPLAEALESWLRERCEFEPAPAAPTLVVQLRRRRGRRAFRDQSRAVSTRDSGQSVPSTGTNP